MYLETLRNCYLFNGCKPRFLDEVLSLARMELFMPHMSILAEGEVVNELMIIVDGEIQGARSGSAAALAHANSTPGKSGTGDELMMEMQRPKARRGSIALDGNPTGSSIGRVSGTHPILSGKHQGSNLSSIHPPSATGAAPGGRCRSSVMFDTSAVEAELKKGLGPHRGSMQGSMGGGPGSLGRNSSNDVPCLQNYWTGCLVRVLILTRSQMDKLSELYPQQVKQILGNMREHVDEAFRLAVADALAKCAIPRPDEAGNFYDNEGNPIDPKAAGKVISLPEEVEEALHDALAGGQSFSAKPMRRPMKSLKDALPTDQRLQLQRLEQLRVLAIKHLRGQAVVKLLLDYQANANCQDAFGITAMFEAVRMGHDHVVDLLKSRRVKLGMDADRVVEAMNTAIVCSDMAMLGRLIRAGGDPNWGDFDRRTPLHLAASECNIAAVELLVEEGRAAVDPEDRWSGTPLDNAQEVGAQPVIDYLQPLYKEIKKGKRKGWRSTAWYLHCQQESERPPTPPKERTSPSAALMVTDGGYTKRGSVAEQGMAMKAGSVAAPGGLPGRLDEEASNVYNSDPAEPPAFGRNDSMQPPSQPGNQDVSAEAPAFGRNSSMQPPSQPGNQDLPEEPPAFGRNNSMQPPSQPGTQDLSAELPTFGRNDSMQPPGNMDFDSEPEFGRNGPSPSDNGDGAVDPPVFGRNGGMHSPSHSRDSDAPAEPPAFGRNGSMMLPSNPGKEPWDGKSM
ncbi:hypothetical protein DUNSADRAFT_6548 [Dunaliella salina]|uniref:Cyclic nucleotide-binding domain-containing protein n=1 Tax=Dunaliella salina TaxID=3046 RepID=A0ABQ7GN58_DUNSA|nr:hypothetical protein DUNSADRAFT_6548 [Dunaliella salina]|eukprot:KAF5836031.1 hypothetical protein DUNSADRAFT_6548 [Dunaliella salina]